VTGDQGGTVRYHRAEYVRGDHYPWRVWFTDGPWSSLFTAEVGRAMGLTPPAPQAHIELADGRNVTINEDVLRDAWTTGWMRLVRALEPLFTDTDEATP
jgi:hypothetical protein